MEFGFKQTIAKPGEHKLRRSGRQSGRCPIPRKMSARAPAGPEMLVFVSRFTTLPPTYTYDGFAQS